MWIRRARVRPNRPSVIIPPANDRPNEPAGMEFITSHDFSSLLAPGWVGNGAYASTYAIGNDPAISLDGGPYLDLLVKQGHTGGNGFPEISFDLTQLSTRYSELYYKYWFRGTPTVQYGSNVQKLLHFWGPSGAAGALSNIGLSNLFISGSGNGYNCIAAFQNAEPSNQGGGGGVSGGTTAGAFSFNEWVRIEGSLKYNTIDVAASADGHNRMWRYRPSTGSTILIASEGLLWTVDVAVQNRWWQRLDIDPTVPGGGSDTPADYHLYFSSLYLSGRPL
jgi:hypothetical protein